MRIGILDRFVPAPDFPAGFKWLNTLEPLPLSKLRGQVVVLDFWTYCCINCMHMLPTLARIEETYRDKPVVVIGVHSAKFENEKDPRNIGEAIKRYGVRHPVIVDEKMRLWKAYGASAWPTIVIIAPDGKVVYKKAGEVQFSELDGAVESTLIDYRYEDILAKAPVKIKRPSTERSGTLLYPGKLALSESGELMAISDSGHNRILVVRTKGGRVVHSVGKGDAALRDGDFGSAAFFGPQGLAWFGENTIYVADTGNHALRSIEIDSEKVATAAGDGRQGLYYPLDFTAKGIGTRINSPWDVTRYSDRLMIAMAGFHQIWGYETRGGLIYPLAGSGAENIFDGTFAEAQFAQPSGISADGDHLYIADSEDSGVRSVDMKGKFVSTLVGTGLFKFGHKDGTLYEALLQHPLGICATGGRVYVADTYNSAIREIDLKAETVSTMVGSPDSSSACKFGEKGCDTLGLYEPGDVKISRDGKVLYIADTNNHLIRHFDFGDMKLHTLEIKP